MSCGNLDDDDDTFQCDEKDMLRFTGKTTQDDALQAVQRAADRRTAKGLKAQTVGLAKTRAEVNSMLGLLQKRTIHNVERKKALEAREDAEMRAFWESAADESSSARQRGTRIIKECKTIRKVPGKPKTATYTRSTNETGENHIAKRKRR